MRCIGSGLVREAPSAFSLKILQDLVDIIPKPTVAQNLRDSEVDREKAGIWRSEVLGIVRCVVFYDLRFGEDAFEAAEFVEGFDTVRVWFLSGLARNIVAAD